MKRFKLNIFISIIIICFVISVFLLNIVSNKVLPIIMEYAISEMKNKSIKIINETISDEIILFNENIIDITKNDNDIQMIDFNSKEVNKMLVMITTNVLNRLKDIENGNINNSFEINKYKKGIIYEIPMGTFTNNFFLNNLGPKIPIKLNIIGDVLSNINTEIKEYGINNALIQMSIHIKVTEKVIIPFISENVNVEVDIPISLKLIQGNIPDYYGGFFSRNSNITSIPTS